jgi:hypothetical protein
MQEVATTFPFCPGGVPEHLASSFVFSTSAEASGLRIGLFHNVGHEPNSVRVPGGFLEALESGICAFRHRVRYFLILAAN